MTVEQDAFNRARDEIIRRMDRWEAIIIDNRARLIMFMLEDAQKTLSTEIADAAAEKAVKKMYLKLDLDVDNAADIRAFKENPRFVAVAHSTAKATVWSFFATVAGLIVSAVWFAAQDFMKK